MQAVLKGKIMKKYLTGLCLAIWHLLMPNSALAQKPIQQPEISTIPDNPIAFGFKANWLAIQSDSAETVLQKLPVHRIQQANWETGFATIFQADDKSQRAIFITPSINGWVLVASYLVLPTLDNLDKVNAFLSPLRENFSQGQFFGSYRVVDYIAWAKAENGKWVRRFAYADGAVLDNFGQQTQAEKTLKLVDIQSTADVVDILQSTVDLNNETVLDALLDEETPLQIAGFWSINPSQLEEMQLSKSTGWVAYLNDVE